MVHSSCFNFLPFVGQGWSFLDQVRWPCAGGMRVRLSLELYLFSLWMLMVQNAAMLLGVLLSDMFQSPHLRWPRMDFHKRKLLESAYKRCVALCWLFSFLSTSILSCKSPLQRGGHLGLATLYVIVCGSRPPKFFIIWTKLESNDPQAH